MKLSHRLFAASVFASASIAHGQATLTWDQPNANNAWNTIDANWTSGATFVTNDNVIFNSVTGETVTVDAGGVSAGTMAVGANNGSWVFDGGSITTSGALTKSGSGTITLNSANSFSSISHSGGVIALGNTGALGGGTINWSAASTLQTSALTSNVTISNAIALSGSGDRTLVMYATTGGGGTNTVELSGQITGSAGRIYLNNSASGAFNPQYIFSNSTNTFTANIHINRGGLRIASNEALGNLANTVTFDSNAGADLTFLNAMTYTRGTVLSTATDFNTGANAVTASGVISGGQRLTKIGSGALTLTGTNTYAGGTTITAGPNSNTTAAIVVGSNAALSTGAVTLNNTGTITALFNGSTSRTVSNNITLSASNVTTNFLAGNATTFELSGVISGGTTTSTFFVNTNQGGGSTGLVKLSGTNTFLGKVQINRGGLAITSDASLGNSANSVFLDIGTATQIGLRFDAGMSSDRAIQFGSGKQVLDTLGNNVALSGVVSGTNGELHKLGSGKLTLSGTNTYTGQTNISGGTLAISGTGSIASSSIIVGASTTFDVSGVTGGYILTSGQTISGTGMIAGNINVAGTIAPGNSPGSLSFGDDVTLAGTVNLEITGITAGSFDRLVGDGANSLTLGGLLALDNTGYTATLGDTLNVFSGWSSITGSFTSITGTDLGGGLSWDTSLLGSTGVMTVIPESSTALLGGIGVIVMLRRRRA